MSPRSTSTLARAFGRAEELDPPRAVDEVEEDELAHVAPGHHAAGDAHRLLGGLPRLERLGRGSNGGHLVAVGKRLGRPLMAASLEHSWKNTPWAPCVPRQ